MPTTVNAPAITVSISVPATHVPANVYAPAITVGITTSPAYISPTPVSPPAGIPFVPILRNSDTMPTPTIVNGRPT